MRGPHMLVPSLLISLIVASSNAAQSLDFRGAWIPSSYDASTPDELCAQMVSLQELGFDRVYLDVWNQGTVYFESPTMAAAGLGNTSAAGADRLLWASENCPEFKGQVFAWFEYGLIAAYGSVNSNPFAGYAEAQGWLLGQEGGGFIWMDVRSGALEFLSALLVDVVKAYPHVAGVQLDDHFAQPTGLAPPDSTKDQQVSWMTDGAQKLAATVRAAAAAAAESKRSVRSAPAMLSLSPTTLQQALQSFAVDWKSWVSGDTPLFDEAVPQLYRSSYDTFAPLLNDTLQALYDSRSPVTAACRVAIGLRLDGSGEPTPWGELEQMLAATAGVPSSLAPYGPPSPCIWYSRGALETYPDEIAAYFDTTSSLRGPR